MKTYQPKHKDITRDWHMINADDEVLGRMSTKITTLLMGKHKPTYSNHMDMGDYVVVVNAQKVKVTGKKREQKVYRNHSGYPGGFKEVSFEKMITEHPERVIELAVSRMLPNNRLRQKRMRRLKVYAGAKHEFNSKFETEKEEK